MFPAITIEFSKAWWWARYGDTAGKDRRRLLFERFGDVGLGEENPRPLTPVVGNEYGHRFMSAFWGCEIVYQNNHAPAALPLPDPRRRMERLEVPDADSSPVIQKALQTARELKALHGECRADVNVGGPLNNAVSVFGDEILLVCAEEPELARRVLRKMSEAIMAVYERFIWPVNGVDPAKARAGDWGLGNCPVGLISPRTYAEVVLPEDLWLKDHFKGNCYLHHCGVFDAYIEAYRPLNPAGLDLGPGSDLRLARRGYPKAQISTYIEVGALSRMSRSQIDDFVKQAIEAAAPAELFTRISAADAGPELSDETVRNFLTVQSRVGSR